jgi:hypothetical protein
MMAGCGTRWLCTSIEFVLDCCVLFWKLLLVPGCEITIIFIDKNMITLGLSSFMANNCSRGLGSCEGYFVGFLLIPSSRTGRIASHRLVFTHYGLLLLILGELMGLLGHAGCLHERAYLWLLALRLAVPDTHSARVGLH